jgi:hypothetical protein
MFADGYGAQGTVSIFIGYTGDVEEGEQVTRGLQRRVFQKKG